VEKGPLGLEPQSSKAKALSPERPADPKGIIHQYKAVKIGRGVALQKLAAWHQAELEVVKIRLIEAVRVNKAQAYFQAEQFLASLEADHRAHLADLGIRNDAVRNEAAERLLTELSKSLRRLHEGNYPDTLRDETIQRMVENYRKSLDKIYHDPTE